MTWKSQFSKDYEVPVVIERMVKDGVLVDVSSRNDVSPSFQIPIEDAGAAVIWVHHPIRDFRELPGARFRVEMFLGGDSVGTVRFTDDLQTALEMLFRYAGRYLASRDPEDPWFDSREYLRDLLVKYVGRA